MRIGEVLRQRLPEIARRIEKVGCNLNEIGDRAETVIYLSDGIKLTINILDGGWSVVIQPSLNDKSEDQVRFTFIPGGSDSEISGLFRRIYASAEKNRFLNMKSHENKVAERLLKALS